MINARYTFPGTDIVILCICIFLYSCKPDGREPSFRREGWRDTIGWVSGVPSRLFINYMVNGKMYRSRFYRALYGSSAEGEKYELSYNVSDPSEIEICYSCPVFMPEESVVTTAGTVKRIRNARWPFDREFTALFTYTIQGTEFERAQTLPADYERKYPGLRAGAAFEVSVWTLQPQRAILAPGRPVTLDKR